MNLAPKSHDLNSRSGMRWCLGVSFFLLAKRQQVAAGWRREDWNDSIHLGQNTLAKGSNFKATYPVNYVVSINTISCVSVVRSGPVVPLESCWDIVELLVRLTALSRAWECVLGRALCCV